MTGQDHSLPGKLIQIRSRELLLSLTPVLPKQADVTGPQVVAQNENDIWPIGPFCFSRCTQGRQSHNGEC